METDKIFGLLDPEQLFPPVDDSSTIMVTCRAEDYSASQLCRAVEDCDAHVINLNVAAERTPDGEMAIYLRINRRVAESAVRSIERFGYQAAALEPAESDASLMEARERANEVLRYLEL